MSKPLVELRGATVELGGRRVLDNVDFVVAAGELREVRGPNGWGKSTLLNVLAGVIPAGSLRISGHELNKLSAAALADLRAWLPQQPTCAWSMTAGEVAALGKADGGAALSLLGIAHLHDRRIDELSGGEARLVHVARCLAQLGVPAGKVLLLDEPDAGLDTEKRARLESALRAFVGAGGAVVMATHGG